MYEVLWTRQLALVFGVTTYAALEAGIGLYALLVPALLTALRHVYVPLRQLELPYGTFAFARTLLAGGALLLPTTLMGGTFPVLTGFLVRSCTT
jgi:spermidine synthase